MCMLSDLCSGGFICCKFSTLTGCFELHCAAVNDLCLVAKMSSHLRNGFAINNSRRESNEYLIYRVALFFNGSKSISSVKNTKAYEKRKIIIFLQFFSHYSKHYNVKMINF